MPTQQTVLVTGATGFIGQALVPVLLPDYTVVTQSKSPTPTPSTTSKNVCLSIHGSTNWRSTLQGVDVVVHLAGYAHKTKDLDEQALMEVNVAGTENLVRQAAKAGVKRFVFISSIKAMGEETTLDDVYTEETPPLPEDDYGRSKLAAEVAIKTVCQDVQMEYVIIRPTLVVSAQVKGNLQVLKKWVRRGWPLPTGSIRNRRSLVLLSGLLELIKTTIVHPKAANELFIAADQRPLSTPDIIRLFERLENKHVVQYPVPPSVIRFLGRLFQRESVTDRLCGDLVVNSKKAYQCFGWSSQTTSEALLDKKSELGKW